MTQLARQALAVALAFGAAAPALAGNVVLKGNYVEIGVNNNGALINDFTLGVGTGLRFDPTGSGNFGNNDLLLRGLPYAFYSVGTAFGASSAIYGSNTFGTTTVDDSAGASLHATTTGGSFDGIGFTQRISFDASQSVVQVAVEFRNGSANPVTQLVYGVGFDPDPDSTSNSSTATDNLIGAQGKGASVTATGPKTLVGITLADTTTAGTSYGVFASIRKNKTTDPYNLNAAVDDGNGDNTINLGYNLGTLNPGDSKTINYEYRLFAAPIPEPGSYAMMLAGLALVGFGARHRPGGRTR